MTMRPCLRPWIDFEGKGVSGVEVLGDIRRH